MRPRSGADFEVLYNELEGWRLQETRRIKESALSPEKQHFALQQLLQKETKLLQTIDRCGGEAAGRGLTWNGHPKGRRAGGRFCEQHLRFCPRD